MKNEVFIHKKTGQPDVTDFQVLQKSAIETIQQLAGNIWTDYNEHDPGVTIMEALNYALTELDYKCSFPLEDYLTGSNEGYHPDDYGLFRPDEVYPSAPVTGNDYRKLIFDTVDEILDIWLMPNDGTPAGIVDLVVDLVPSVTDSEKNGILNRIISLYHSNRNIAENLGTVHFREKEKMSLTGEIILHEEANVAETLARIYFECARYFNSGIKYHNLRELIKENADWSELFDGPLLKNGIIDDYSVLPMKKTFSVSDIYNLIRNINGVKAVREIFMESNGVSYSDEINCTDILKTYTIRFPFTKSEVELVMYKNNKEAKFDFEEMLRWYKKFIIDEFGHQNQFTGLTSLFDYPKGSSGDLSEYSSVQNDFPDFYGINHHGVPDFFPEERKAKAMQLKGYLLIFDMLLAGTSQELSKLNQLLRLDANLPDEILPDLSSSVAHWAKLVDNSLTNTKIEHSSRFKRNAKNAIFDRLDVLYGEKSYLSHLEDFDLYHSVVDRDSERLKQRARFIMSEPNVIPERSLGVNLLIEKPENVPGLKKWFSYLLDLPAGIELPVTNIFSKYSLRLLSDSEFYEDMRGMLNIDFVINNLGENFQNETIFDIQPMVVDDPADTYNEFRDQIYLLHHNIIFESFLRDGIDIANYKIVQPRDDVFLLAYHAREKAEWVSLGRFEKKPEAEVAANQLCVFLAMLNRYSENLYLVEHLLLSQRDKDEGYTLFVKNENGELLFRLLNPVGRDEVYAIEEQIKKSLKQPEQFSVKLSETGEYVILFKTGGDNAVYCQQSFSNEEEAVSYLEWLKENCNPEILINYQLAEGVLLPSDFMDFGLTIVFPNWSARFYNPKFRAWCEEILEERRPAHVKINFLWLKAPDMRLFEKIYFDWRSAWAEDHNLRERSIQLARFLTDQLSIKHGTNN